MLRKEFMKYLKEYRLFESDVIPSYMVDDIRDRLIDLEDLGRIKTSIVSTSGKHKKYVSFYLNNHIEYDGFLFEEISFYVFWLKKYLGDNFKSCYVLFIKDKVLSGPRMIINLDNKEDLIKLKENPIDDLIIVIK